MDRTRRTPWGVPLRAVASRRLGRLSRLRRFAALLGLPLALLVGPAARAEPPPDCPPTAQPPTLEDLKLLRSMARDRGFLWRIRRDGRTSWLYGTIHVARRGWVLPGPVISRALNAVDTIALELDPLDPAVQAALARGVAGLRRPALPEALDARLAQQARDGCIPEARFATLPAGARMMLLATQVGRRDGLDPAYGVDAMLAGFGHARNLGVVSLETPGLQFAALDMGSDEATVAWIDASLASLEGGAARSQLEGLADAWSRGDLEAMTACPAGERCGSAEEQGFKRRVLDDRNPALAAAIDALHAGGKQVFAAVGSLHMVGPTGLPALLEAQGYTVERMIFEKP